MRIDQDGDIRIKVEDKTWIFSPVCINPMDNQAVAKEIPAIPPAECVDSDVDSDVADTQSNGKSYVCTPMPLFSSLLSLISN